MEVIKKAMFDCPAVSIEPIIEESETSDKSFAIAAASPSVVPVVSTTAMITVSHNTTVVPYTPSTAEASSSRSSCRLSTFEQTAAMRRAAMEQSLTSFPGFPEHVWQGISSFELKYYKNGLY